MKPLGWSASLITKSNPESVNVGVIFLTRGCIVKETGDSLLTGGQIKR